MRQTWRYIEENDVSAHYGLATDEHLMSPYVADAKSEHQATLRLYNYTDYCALVGRFQNIHAELDLDSCTQQNVEFGRRQTGGGAIIMGKDQLGLCVTCSSKSFEWTNIRDLCYLFSLPVIDALSKLGVNAEFRAKNDLEVNGKKIAGLGVYIDPHGAIQFHCSLLINLDILKMLSVLQIPIQKYSDKRKTNAVSQRMTTVSGELGRNMTQDDVRALICKSFETHFDVKMDHSNITAEEEDEISALVKEKYSTENWIYQQTPQADLTGMSLIKTPAGLLRIYIGLKGEIIKSVLITGDFIEHEQLFKEIEARLKWSPLDKDQILKVVTSTLKRAEEANTQKLRQPKEIACADTQSNILPQEQEVKRNTLPRWSVTLGKSSRQDSSVRDSRQVEQTRLFGERGQDRRAMGVENPPIILQNDMLEAPRTRHSDTRPTDTQHPVNLQHETLSPTALANAIFLAAQKAYSANEHTYQGTCYYPKRTKAKASNKEPEVLNK